MRQISNQKLKSVLTELNNILGVYDGKMDTSDLEYKVYTSTVVDVLANLPPDSRIELINKYTENALTADELQEVIFDNLNKEQIYTYAFLGTKRILEFGLMQAKEENRVENDKFLQAQGYINSLKFEDLITD